MMQTEIRSVFFNLEYSISENKASDVFATYENITGNLYKKITALTKKRLTLMATSERIPKIRKPTALATGHQTMSI